jgi:hypothetical protein
VTALYIVLLSLVLMMAAGTVLALVLAKGWDSEARRWER